MTFEKIKYWYNPHVLGPPISGKPLIFTLQLRKNPYEHYAFSRMRGEKKSLCNSYFS